ncbi:helix-turn-helix transcriptional regulator (plasmid) [Haloferax sp. S1W]|uniref:helix-turn-helix transcriptional regulator n=1 Tax=Haloferax sp. S1W TaxID=3377110 RepID=UPI0037C80878
MRVSAFQGEATNCLVVGVAVIVCGGVIAGVFPAGVVAAESTPGSSNSPDSPDSPDSVIDSVAPGAGYDDIVIRIKLRRDGTAHWQVLFRYRLDDAAAERAFEQARQNVSNPPGVFIDRMQQAVSSAEARTGRSMRVQNGSVETYTSVPAGRFGVVSYRFEWTNFAATTADSRYVLGDAIRRYRLSENESLWIEWSESFRKESVSPAPDASQERAVRWDGRQWFQSDNPKVVLVATGAAEQAEQPILPAVGAAGLLLAVVLGWYSRSHWCGVETTHAAETRSVPSDELLSNRECVLQLLEDRGGRMKQQELIEAMEWSRTKTSNVVNEMHEAEQIEVFRLGRENVLALPGEIEI